jgi:hypothetical protein
MFPDPGGRSIHRSFRETLPQGLADEQLGHDVRNAVLGTDVVDGQDVRVVQGRGRQRLDRRTLFDSSKGPIESNERREHVGLCLSRAVFR